MKRHLPLALCLSLTACVTHDGIMAGLNRNALNDEIEDCATTHGGHCKELGDDLAGFSIKSRRSDWQQPRDIVMAKRAWDLGCNAGDGACCAAIVEHKLYDNEVDARRYRTLAAYYGYEVRTPEDLAAEDSETRKQLREIEHGLAETRAAERADHDRQLAAIGSAAQQTGQQIAATGAEHQRRMEWLSSGQAAPSTGGKSSSSSSSVAAGAKKKPERKVVPLNPPPDHVACIPVGNPGCQSGGTQAVCCDTSTIPTPGHNTCENDKCCGMLNARCTSSPDCCPSTGSVCGGGRCCMPAGSPCGPRAVYGDVGNPCCNGCDTKAEKCL